MANERYGNNYLTTIGVEATYGTEAANYEVVLPNKVEIKKLIASIDVSGIKTGALDMQKCEKQSGYESGEATISGGLNTGADADTLHGILLEAFFMDSATPFIVPAVGTTPKYYTIHQYFNDDKSTKMLGSVCDGLDITGDSGGIISFSSKFRGLSVAYETDVSAKPSGDPFASIPETCPVLFSNATLTTLGSESNITSMNSFSISLVNEYADDKSIYQNSVTKAQEILASSTGTFTIEWNYDSANDDDVSGKIMADALASVVFAITDGTTIWTFTLYGKITDYTPADPEKGVFTSSMNMTLMGDSNNESVSVAIT